MRSFVPIEKKSTCSAKLAAAAAVAASSTMMPSGGGSVPAAFAASRQLGADVPHLVERPDHGDHDAEVGAGAGRQDRLELRGERARGGEERAQAFGAGERRDLVAGEVEQPDHGALAREQAEDRAPSHARCSSRDGQPRAPVNGISVRSRPTPAAPLARPSRVSAADATLHSTVTGSPSAVCACPEAASAPRRFLLLSVSGWRWAPETRARSAGAGSTASSPAAASSIGGVAGRSGEHRRVGACQHRQAETAGDDRRVRARAAADRDRPGQASVVGEPDQVRRVHLAADQDERAVRGGRGIAPAQP